MKAELSPVSSSVAGAIGAVCSAGLDGACAGAGAVAMAMSSSSPSGTVSPRSSLWSGGSPEGRKDGFDSGKGTQTRQQFGRLRRAGAQIAGRGKEQELREARLDRGFRLTQGVVGFLNADLMPAPDGRGIALHRGAVLLQHLHQ